MKTKMKTKQEMGCVNYKKRIFHQFLSYLLSTIRRKEQHQRESDIKGKRVQNKEGLQTVATRGMQ